MSFSITSNAARPILSRLLLCAVIAVAWTAGAGAATAEARSGAVKAKSPRIDRVTTPPAVVKRAATRVRVHGRAAGRKVG